MMVKLLKLQKLLFLKIFKILKIKFIKLTSWQRQCWTKAGIKHYYLIIKYFLKIYGLWNNQSWNRKKPQKLLNYFTINIIINNNKKWERILFMWKKYSNYVWYIIDPATFIKYKLDCAIFWFIKILINEIFD